MLEIDGRVDSAAGGRYTNFPVWLPVNDVET